MAQTSILTVRQRQVFELLLKDVGIKEISIELGIAKSTVQVHISAVMKKLNVRNRNQAVVELVRIGELGI